MFEFALSEMLLIGVVALVVLGPQRLPKVARTVGLWVGKIQYFVSNVKTELSRQVEASELRDVKESLESAARGLQDNLRDIDATARQEAKEIAAAKSKLAQDKGKGKAKTAPVVASV